MFIIDSNAEGKVGILERRHLNVSDFVYSASNIERTGIIDDVRYETYVSDEDLLEKITSMNLEEAKNLGIPRRTFYRIKRRLREYTDVKLRPKTIKRLI